MIITKHLAYGGESNHPNLIVIHAMGEHIEGEPDLHAADFLDKIGLSAHALITPDGNIIHCREDYETAWHAKGFNKDSLGIEFLVPGIHTYGSFMERIKTPYITDEQLKAGLWQIKVWVERYNINNIKRHSELSPGRKFDPGDGFDMNLFIQET